MEYKVSPKFSLEEFIKKYSVNQHSFLMGDYWILKFGEYIFYRPEWQSDKMCLFKNCFHPNNDLLKYQIQI